MVVGREAPMTPGCLKKLLKTRSMASHSHRKVCVFNLNPNIGSLGRFKYANYIWFSVLQIVLQQPVQYLLHCVAAGSAPAATPVQPKLQHSATFISTGVADSAVCH